MQHTRSASRVLWLCLCLESAAVLNPFGCARVQAHHALLGVAAGVIQVRGAPTTPFLTRRRASTFDVDDALELSLNVDATDYAPTRDYEAFGAYRFGVDLDWDIDPHLTLSLAGSVSPISQRLTTQEGAASYGFAATRTHAESATFSAEYDFAPDADFDTSAELAVGAQQRSIEERGSDLQTSSSFWQGRVEGTITESFPYKTELSLSCAYYVYAARNSAPSGNVQEGLPDLTLSVLNVLEPLRESAGLSLAHYFGPLRLVLLGQAARYFDGLGWGVSLGLRALWKVTRSLRVSLSAGVQREAFASGDRLDVATLSTDFKVPF